MRAKKVDWLDRKSFLDDYSDDETARSGGRMSDWTTSKAEANKLVDELSEVCFEYGKNENNEKLLDVFYKTKALKNYVGIMQGLIDVRTARIASLEAEVEALKAERRWIPVSERLPEEDTDGNTLMAICRHSGEWVRAPFGAEFADEFVRHYSYWMYAPQPPEVEE